MLKTMLTVCVVAGLFTVGLAHATVSELPSSSIALASVGAAIGGLISWIVANPQVVMTAVGTVYTLVRSVEAVWAAKDRRADTLRRAMIQSFTAVEGLAWQVKDQWPAAVKLQRYLELISGFLKATGQKALSPQEVEMAKEVAGQFAAAKKVPGWSP